MVGSGLAERASKQDHDDDTAHAAVRWIYDYVRGTDRRPFFLKVSFTHPHDFARVRRKRRLHAVARVRTTRGLPDTLAHRRPYPS